MKTVPYIFWAVAGFLVGGCAQSQPEYVLVYRPELRQEQEGLARARAIGSAGRLATAADVEGLNLNVRRQFTVDSPYIPEGEIVRYELDYVDRHATAGHYAGRHGWWGGYSGAGALRRTFRYRRTGTMVR